jgi:hypothetical protein
MEGPRLTPEDMGMVEGKKVEGPCIPSFDTEFSRWQLNLMQRKRFPNG